MTSRIGGLILILWLFLAYHSPASAFDHTSTPATPGLPHPPTKIATHLKLQFDGCFRPPRDPGFPTIPYRMAVCAACVGKVDRGITVTPLAVGAMEIPVSVETTSQHAEYEGLLMGLRWLVNFISSQIGNETNLLNQDDSPGEARVLITIEGDCKTVIDQLTGKSIPRKLESLHHRAKGLLAELGSMRIFPTFSGAESSMDGQVIAEVRHIPRDQNSISDSLCNNLMSILSTKSWAANIQLLDQTKYQIMKQRLLSSQVFTAASPSLSEILEAATKTTKNSLRAPFYRLVASIALEANDYELLVKIGEKLIEDESSLKIHTNFRPEGEAGDQGHNGKNLGKTTMSLKRTGIIYQICGWEGLQNEKKKKFLQRKYRKLLSNEYCDGNNIDSVDGFLQFMEGEKHFYSMKSIGAMKHMIIQFGDISEGKWNALVPNEWKPMLDEWFFSARYDQVNEGSKDMNSPVWIGQC